MEIVNPFLSPETSIGLNLPRRVFLGQTLALATVLSTGYWPHGAAAASTTASVADLTQEPWRTLNAVQQRLWPSDGNGPGAAEIQALRYLHQVLTHHPIAAADKKFILDGVGWLEGVAQHHHKTAFYALPPVQQEAVLREITQSEAGENWVSNLMTYIFEALLGDPVYGGNPQQVGWQWLEHTAGFPQPSAPYYVARKGYSLG